MARTDMPVCSPEDLVGEIAQGARAAVVVDAGRVVVGLLRARELQGPPERRVESVMVVGPSTFRPFVPIKEMADYLSGHDLESAPITTSDGKLVGVLFRDDAVRAAEGCPDCARKMI